LGDTAGARKDKKKKKKSDGGRRQGRKTEDKHSPVKRKTWKEKQGKRKTEKTGGLRSAEAPPQGAQRRAVAAATR
jgi:hypothetical protein